MGTTTQPVTQPVRESKRDSYQHHSVEFKRSVVQQSLEPGASVSRIAREHNINANQVFAWRKLFREGRLGGGEAEITLLPVRISAPVKAAQSTSTVGATVPAGVIELVIGKARLRIEGRVDETVLAQVLAHLPR